MESDIRQLAALCDQQDEEAFLPMKPSELAPEFPRRMAHLNRLVDDAGERANGEGIANTEGLKVTPQTTDTVGIFGLAAKIRIVGPAHGLASITNSGPVTTTPRCGSHFLR